MLSLPTLTAIATILAVTCAIIIVHLVNMDVQLPRAFEYLGLFLVTNLSQLILLEI